ncbi:tetratricopeptide repeat protein [Pseudemcibacter aquimaris]|uniref:tetratricopeptide repeat protein n=1 Tax=Pseudemcibacter aquimaris TaxID=2857064 RepID=UPI0020132997|nr:tetratricopeptide repeat protein [Pseudemcibacter aquimaris]MCC3860139.1 tetratricopeptide repeat protein [Pseudemcibacter aquimaris]WDU57466.1 tetratricopeptide repeat protein [Pseudemcibacter aquimaris]
MSDVRRLYQLGMGHFKSKKLFEAKECFEKANVIAPNDPKVSEILGYCYYLLGDFAKAKFQYENSIKNSPNGATSQQLGLYANLLLDINDEAGCEHFCKMILEKDPGYMPALKTLGDMYRAKHNQTDAIKCYGKIIEKTPNDYSTLTKLSGCYHSICLWDKAEGVDNRLIDFCEEIFETGMASPVDIHSALMFSENADFMKKIAVNLSNAYIEIQKKMGVELPQYSTV